LAETGNKTVNQSVKNATLYAAIISLGGFVFGFDASVISGTLGFVISDFDLSPAQIGYIFFWTGLAAMASSFTVGTLADYIGRKRTLIFLACLYIVSALVSAFSVNYQMLLIGRSIGGYAFGSLVIAPIYIAEISPAKLRGRLGSINQLNIVIGLSAAYFVNLVLLNLSQSDGSLLQSWNIKENLWKWMFAVELVPATLWLILLSLLPKSPRWLGTKNDWIGAEKVLEKIVEPEEMKASLADIKAALGTKQLTLGHQLKRLIGPGMPKILLIAAIIAIVQQITGINAIFYFATTIFELTGIGQNAAFVQAVVVGLVNVIVTLIVIGLIDKIGRKPLMITGLCGIVLSMGAATWGFKTSTYEVTPEAKTALIQIVNPATGKPYLSESNASSLIGQKFKSDVAFKQAVEDKSNREFVRDHYAAILKNTMSANTKLILLGIIGFVASFAFSLGPIMWVFLGEIFPVQVRGLAISLVTVLNSGVSMLITTFFPIQLAANGVTSVFTFFFIWSVIGLVFIAWLMPETKGLTLEEIEAKFTKPKTFET